MNGNVPQIQPVRLRRTLKKMLDIYSPYGKEEEILEYLTGVLKRKDLPVELMAVDDNRDNLLVLPKNGEVSLVFVGHLDTVMAHDLESYGAEEEDDIIRGLGAADMKGGCAAMLEAVMALYEAGDPPPVALALVVGEEWEGDGSARLLEEFHCPWAVIGEPTDLKPCLGHYSYLEIRVRARGQRRHASLSRPGQNPIEGVLRLLLKVSGYLEERRPGVIYNIRDMMSSPEGFVVPEVCEAFVDCHLPPRHALGEITMELEELAIDAQEATPNLEQELRFMTIHNGYLLPERGPVIQSLKDIYAARNLDWAPEVFRSHSDANQFWAAGIKPLLLGPGRLQEAHAPEEWVDFAQVETAANLYLELARSLVKAT